MGTDAWDRTPSTPSSEPFLCILGQRGSICRRRSLSSGKARMWPRLVSVPHQAACLGMDLQAVALGCLWGFSDEAGEECAGCVREGIVPTATYSRYILSRSDTMAYVLPNNCNRKALPIISYSISSSFPLPGLGTTAPEQWGRAWCEYPAGRVHVTPR